MPTLFLTEAHVRELMDMDASIDVIQAAFQALADGTAMNVPRRRARAPGILLHGMTAAAEYLGLVGWKMYTTTKDGARFHVGVYDAESGEFVALIEADYLGRLRTGAASGVATEFMANPEAAVVGVFGTGKQAATQLQAVCKVRRIERVEVYSRNAEKREDFAEDMSELCAVKVTPAHSPEAAADEKDIVICATTSKAPVFDGRVLDEGTHLNVVGSNHLGKAEIDVTTVRRANHIVCDSIEACQLEAGDFKEALEDGSTDWRHMHDLSDVVAGCETGRATVEDVTLFKSVGLAIEDIAMAAELLTRARAAGLGTPLPI